MRAQDIECYHQGTIRGRCTQRMCIRCWCLRSCLRDTVCRRTVNSCNSCTRHSLSHCIRPLGTCCQCRGSNHCKKSRRSDPGIVCPLGTTCNCSCRSRSYTCRGCNLCRLRLYSRCMEQPDTDLLYNSCSSRTRSGLCRFGICRRRTLHTRTALSGWCRFQEHTASTRQNQPSSSCQAGRRRIARCSS